MCIRDSNEAAVYNDTFALKGEYYDWVEIKNVSKESVKLSDYCLSDDRRELEKWSLPNRTLAKGQSILIYCTGEENPTTGNGLRANFALNASSETLYLTKKGESAAADFVWLHDIPYGYSMGRTDAENGFFYLRRQTPNKPNETDAYRYISEAPTANRESGVFEAGQTVRVKLAAAGDIYYTTDGSAPTEESTPYTGAITVDKTTVLRAAAVEEGGAPSRALTLSFFIGEEHTLPVLSLVTDSPRRFSETYNGAVKYRECAANLSLLAPEGGFSIDCGVELKGRTSLFNPKKSLGVSFRGCYGAETLRYDIFGKGPAEFTELSIRAGQDYISTVFRNELMQELCAELDTTVTQRSRYCVLYINGEYWGIYCLKDDITRQFYANLTGTAKEDVTMLPSPVAQNTAVYTEALGLWQDTTLTRREAYKRFCEAMDMDGFIDWVLLEGYCANVDIKSNLRYFRTGDGPWQIAFYDLDWAFQTRSNCFFNLIGSEQTAQIAPTIRWLFGIDDEQEGAFRFHDNTERELDAFGAQIFEALGINVEVRDDTHLPEMIGRWGYRFPSNEEFASFSQSSLTDVDPAHDDPDDVVIEYYDRSYLLFKLYERAVIQHDYDAAPFVSDGIIDVDSFTSFYTSVRNRRMSRAGKVLEIHIAHILDARGIEYEAQAKTENGKKPDFLFPSQAAYEDPTFPETQLRMLASKTSIKDRFRQVADEANRIRDKHLFTLTPGDVTHPKLAQLDELHIHLVMPKVVKESYDDLIQGETMTFSRFIEEVQGLQAGRPQSLTLL